MNSSGRKIVSILMSILCFATQVLFANQIESSFWAERRKNNEVETHFKAAPQVASLSPLLSQMPPLQTSFVNPASTTMIPRNRSSSFLQGIVEALPRTKVSIHETFEAKNPAGLPVVLIQDVHLNGEAQDNIASALQSLIDREKVGVVNVEGAEGKFDFSPFRKLGSRELRQQLAKGFVHENLMSAPSYVGISNDVTPPFYGVDSMENYQANVKAYQESHLLIPTVNAQLGDAERALSFEKKKAFSPELMVFDSWRNDFSEDKLSFGEYVLKLSGYPVELNFAYEQFLQAYKMEKSLDFNRVEKERTLVVEKLTKTLSKAGIEQLLASSLAYRSGEIGFGAYYKLLRDLCQKNGIDLRQTPNFDNYVKYVLLSDGIKADKLFDALAEREEKIEILLATTPREKELLAQSNFLRLTKKLVEFELTPKEWAAYQRIVPGSWFLVPGDGQYKKTLSLQGTRNQELGTISLKPFEDFYREADVRSERMVANMLEGVPGSWFLVPSKKNSPSLLGTRNQESGTISKVLIAGGFHTPHITSLLRAQNIPYVVASPKLTKVESAEGTKYLSVFSQEKTPLDELFKGATLFLNPAFLLAGAPSRPGSDSKSLTSQQIGGIFEVLMIGLKRSAGKTTRVFSSVLGGSFSVSIGAVRRARSLNISFGDRFVSMQPVLSNSFTASFNFVRRTLMPKLAFGTLVVAVFLLIQSKAFSSGLSDVTEFGQKLTGVLWVSGLDYLPLFLVVALLVYVIFKAILTNGKRGRRRLNSIFGRGGEIQLASESENLETRSLLSVVTPTTEDPKGSGDSVPVDQVGNATDNATDSFFESFGNSSGLDESSPANSPVADLQIESLVGTIEASFTSEAILLADAASKPDLFSENDPGFIINSDIEIGTLLRTFVADENPALFEPNPALNVKEVPGTTTLVGDVTLVQIELPNGDTQWAVKLNPVINEEAVFMFSVPDASQGLSLYGGGIPPALALYMVQREGPSGTSEIRWAHTSAIAQQGFPLDGLNLGDSTELKILVLEPLANAYIYPLALNINSAFYLTGFTSEDLAKLGGGGGGGGGSGRRRVGLFDEYYSQPENFFSGPIRIVQGTLDTRPRHPFYGYLIEFLRSVAGKRDPYDYEVIGTRAHWLASSGFKSPGMSLYSSPAQFTPEIPPNNAIPLEKLRDDGAHIIQLDASNKVRAGVISGLPESDVSIITARVEYFDAAGNLIFGVNISGVSGKLTLINWPEETVQIRLYLYKNGELIKIDEASREEFQPQDPAKLEDAIYPDPYNPNASNNEEDREEQGKLGNQNAPLGLVPAIGNLFNGNNFLNGTPNAPPANLPAVIPASAGEKKETPKAESPASDKQETPLVEPEVIPVSDASSSPSVVAENGGVIALLVSGAFAVLKFIQSFRGSKTSKPKASQRDSQRESVLDFPQPAVGAIPEDSTPVEEFGESSYIVSDIASARAGAITFPQLDVTAIGTAEVEFLNAKGEAIKNFGGQSITDSTGKVIGEKRVLPIIGGKVAVSEFPDNARSLVLRVFDGEKLIALNEDAYFTAVEVFESPSISVAPVINVRADKVESETVAGRGPRINLEEYFEVEKSGESKYLHIMQFNESGEPVESGVLRGDSLQKGDSFEVQYLNENGGLNGKISEGIIEKPRELELLTIPSGTAFVLVRIKRNGETILLNDTFFYPLQAGAEKSIRSKLPLPFIWAALNNSRFKNFISKLAFFFLMTLAGSQTAAFDEVLNSEKPAAIAVVGGDEEVNIGADEKSYRDKEIEQSERNLKLARLKAEMARLVLTGRVDGEIPGGKTYKIFRQDKDGKVEVKTALVADGFPFAETQFGVGPVAREDAARALAEAGAMTFEVPGDGSVDMRIDTFLDHPRPKDSPYAVYLDGKTLQVEVYQTGSDFSESRSLVTKVKVEEESFSFLPRELKPGESTKWEEIPQNLRDIGVRGYSREINGEVYSYRVGISKVWDSAGAGDFSWNNKTHTLEEGFLIVSPYGFSYEKGIASYNLALTNSFLGLASGQGFAIQPDSSGKNTIIPEVFRRPSIIGSRSTNHPLLNEINKEMHELHDTLTRGQLPPSEKATVINRLARLRDQYNEIRTIVFYLNNHMAMKAVKGDLEGAKVFLEAQSGWVSPTGQYYLIVGRSQVARARSILKELDKQISMLELSKNKNEIETLKTSRDELQARIHFAEKNFLDSVVPAVSQYERLWEKLQIYINDLKIEEREAEGPAKSKLRAEIVMASESLTFPIWGRSASITPSIEEAEQYALKLQGKAPKKPSYVGALENLGKPALPYRSGSSSSIVSPPHLNPDRFLPKEERGFNEEKQGQPNIDDDGAGSWLSYEMNPTYYRNAWLETPFVQLVVGYSAVILASLLGVPDTNAIFYLALGPVVFLGGHLWNAKEFGRLAVWKLTLYKALVPVLGWGLLNMGHSMGSTLVVLFFVVALISVRHMGIQEKNYQVKTKNKLKRELRNYIQGEVHYDSAAASEILSVLSTLPSLVQVEFIEELSKGDGSLEIGRISTGSTTKSALFDLSEFISSALTEMVKRGTLTPAAANSIRHAFGVELRKRFNIPEGQNSALATSNSELIAGSSGAILDEVSQLSAGAVVARYFKGKEDLDTKLSKIAEDLKRLENNPGEKNTKYVAVAENESEAEAIQKYFPNRVLVLKKNEARNLSGFLQQFNDQNSAKDQDVTFNFLFPNDMDLTAFVDVDGAKARFFLMINDAINSVTVEIEANQMERNNLDKIIRLVSSQA